DPAAHSHPRSHQPDAGGSAAALARRGTRGPRPVRGAAGKRLRHRPGPADHRVSGAAHTITLRPATAGDLPQVLAFIRELAVYERLEREVVATEADLGAALFGPRPFAEVILACLDGTPVGFALFFHNFSTFLGRPGIYLEDLFVRPEFRRRGVGLALFRRLAQLAVERQCGRLEWAVLNWNEPALRFYRNLGATPMSDWTVQRLTGEALRRLAAPPG